ncbi:unnamed protein product [Boreogadus saida]
MAILNNDTCTEDGRSASTRGDHIRKAGMLWKAPATGTPGPPSPGHQAPRHRATSPPATGTPAPDTSST